jgi:hypothetical protein
MLHVRITPLCHLLRMTIKKLCRYNPPDKSFPGYNEGIRVGLKVPDSVLANKSSQETKEAWLLNNLHIYLHRKGERAFYV